MTITQLPNRPNGDIVLRVHPDNVQDIKRLRRAAFIDRYKLTARYSSLRLYWDVTSPSIDVRTAAVLRLVRRSGYERARANSLAPRSEWRQWCADAARYALDACGVPRA